MAIENILYDTYIVHPDGDVSHGHFRRDSTRRSRRPRSGRRKAVVAAAPARDISGPAQVGFMTIRARVVLGGRVLGARCRAEPSSPRTPHPEQTGGVHVTQTWLRPPRPSWRARAAATHRRWGSLSGEKAHIQRRASSEREGGCRATHSPLTSAAYCRVYVYDPKRTNAEGGCRSKVRGRPRRSSWVGAGRPHPLSRSLAGSWGWPSTPDRGGRTGPPTFPGTRRSTMRPSRGIVPGRRAPTFRWRRPGPATPRGPLSSSLPVRGPLPAVGPPEGSSRMPSINPRGPSSTDAASGGASFRSPIGSSGTFDGSASPDGSSWPSCRWTAWGISSRRRTFVPSSARRGDASSRAEFWRSTSPSTPRVCDRCPSGTPGRWSCVPAGASGSAGGVTGGRGVDRLAVGRWPTSQSGPPIIPFGSSGRPSRMPCSTPTDWRELRNRPADLAPCASSRTPPIGNRRRRSVGSHPVRASWGLGSWGGNAPDPVEVRRTPAPHRWTGRSTSATDAPESPRDPDRRRGHAHRPLPATRPSGRAGPLAQPRPGWTTAGDRLE